MKRILVFSLLSCTLLVACGPSEQAERSRHAAHRYGDRGAVDETLIAPEPPLNPIPAAPTVTEEQAPAPVVSVSHPTPAPVVVKRETNTYGKPVPGKPGFVTRPYSPDAGLVDVRGYPPGTQVKDPYTGKIFLVP